MAKIIKGKKSASKPTGKPAQHSTDRPPMVKCGALWLKTARSGDKFMSGVIEVNGEKVNLLVFKNGYKEESKHPDYVIYESPEHNRETPKGYQASDDDIPF